MFRQMLLEKEENSGIAPVFDEAGRPVYVFNWSLVSFTSEVKK